MKGNIEAPVFIVEVSPFHLSKLMGRGVHFIRDSNESGTVLASVDIVDEGTRRTPTKFESHTTSGPLSQVTSTIQAGVCMACVDRHGKHVAFILIEESG